MQVLMDESECRIALHLAKCRNSVCRSNNIVDKQMGDQDAIQIDYDGMLAELAVAKQFNVYPDLSISPRHGGADLTLRGLKADVKASRYKKAHLCIHKDKDPKAVDMYILTIVDGQSVEIVGFIESKDAIRDENLGDLGHGEGYVIPQERLSRF